MVKNLADELTDILNWVENPGLGERPKEEARLGLIIFCRGLVCGLRQAEKDVPSMLDEGLVDAYKTDWERAEQKRRADEAQCREERYRNRDENARLRPVDECNIPMMGKTPVKECLKD